MSVSCCGAVIDFCYYVMHRSAHNINLFWGGHKVHHSSEEYNFTTALRQGTVTLSFQLSYHARAKQGRDRIYAYVCTGAFEPLFGYVVYLPLSLFFDSHVYMTHNELNAVYQVRVSVSCVW